MIIRKAFRFRLKTNNEVAHKLNQFAGHTRFVWNRFQAINETRLEQKQPLLWYQEMAFWLTLWKQSEEYGFLKDAPSQILQQKLRDLDKAYRDGFDKQQQNKRLPKKHKKTVHNSFRYPQGFKVEGRRLYLPKLGWVVFHKSQEIVGTAKNVTISKKGNHWYAAIQVEQEIERPYHPAKTAVGIDLGIAKFAALSTGETISPVNCFRKQEVKLRILQQALSRKERYSNNWRAMKKRLASAHEQIGDIRRDFLHKASTRISKSHAMIVVEDLKITNMSRSASGTLETPGKNVAAKSGLNKSIRDQGWGEFQRQLTYKQAWRGGLLMKVSPRNTSIKCIECGHIDKRNRILQSHFCCVDCGHAEDADIHAAKNVLAAGHAELACGSNPARGRKQEPLRKRELYSA